MICTPKVGQTFGGAYFMAKNFKTRGKSPRIFFVLTKVRKKGYNMREVNMVLYHGSSVEVSQPEILSAERALDFGAGFYTTTDREQAERWARRVTVRNCAAPPLSVIS